MALVRGQGHLKLAFYVSKTQGSHSKLFLAFMYSILWVLIPQEIEVEYFGEYYVLSVPRNQNKVIKASSRTNLNNLNNISSSVSQYLKGVSCQDYSVRVCPTRSAQPHLKES